VTGAPVESATVADMTVEGQGVVAGAGKRVFVAGALTGETIEFRRHRARRHYDEAQLLSVRSAASQRVSPPCEYFGRCGGCTLQHLSADGQLALKEATLLDNLRRIGAVEPAAVLPPVRSQPWGYRRRARLAARFVPGKGRVLVGFSEHDSSRITDMQHCQTLTPTAAALLSPLSELIGGLSLAQRIPQVEVVAADNALALVLRVLDEPGAADRDALRRFRDRHACRLLLQPGGPDSIAGLDLADNAELWYELAGLGLRLHFGPTDFIQVNAAVNRALVDVALTALDPGPQDRLLDLYCGIGNFTLPLARRAGRVLGVEGDSAMVARARDNARHNQLSNVEFAVADLAAVPAAGAWRGQPWDGVLLDPPRAGAAGVLAGIAASGAGRVVYVSCHPGTLARDAGLLVREHGFRLVGAGILDMFPATSHVESLAVFERR
jgi:23S rRNA (uracil1939-C5)-methyltransferase